MTFFVKIPMILIDLRQKICSSLKSWLENFIRIVVRAMGKGLRLCIENGRRMWYMLKYMLNEVAYMNEVYIVEHI